MASIFSTEQLARVSARRPWLTVGLWLVLLVAAVVAASGLDLTSDDKTYVEMESETADRLIDERMRAADPAPADTGQSEYVLMQSAGQTVDEPGFRSMGERLIAELRGLPAVAGVLSYYETGDAQLVSADQRTLLIPTTLRRGDAEELVGPVLGAVHRFDGRDGFTVVTGGEGSVDRTVSEAAEQDLQTAEVIGLPIALVVLIVVFGALLVAVVPIGVGVGAIVVAVGATTLIGRTFDLSVYVLNMIGLIGMAVGIDYSLLVVQRFREERRNGLSQDEAIARTGATALRAVFFSGLAVIVALCGLLLVPHSIFRGLGAGAIVVVITAVAAALTLLPAALRLLGDRVDAMRLPLPGRRRSAEQSGGFWSWMASFVMRHALVSVVLSVGLLVAASLPYLTIKLGQAGVGSLPPASDPYRAFTILDREFTAGVLNPTEIVVDAPDVTAPAVQDGVARLRERLATDADFRVIGEETDRTDSLMVVEVLIGGDAQSDQAQDALGRLRRQYIPEAFAGTGAEVLVGGDSAEVADFSDLIGRYTPAVFAFVLGLSFVILLVVFRSVVVPLKAIVMNLLSVSAAYGLMVLVFQHGIGHRLLGFRQVERIDAWVPLFMFAVLFGLSMDYHVFLLSRIRERFGQTRDNAESVAFGVRTTAGMITGAALIMVAVFAGFAMGDLVMFQQMGFGLAVAVILDATIIRTVLVPASMALLGDRNWYLPRWLEWLPRIEVEGGAQPAPARQGAMMRRAEV